MTEKIDKVLQSAAVATGNGETLDVSGYGSIAFQVTGITTATVTFEATIDGSNWVAIQAANSTTEVVATTATADGIYTAVVAGYQKVRARISAWTTGTLYVTALATAASGRRVIAETVAVATLPSAQLDSTTNAIKVIDYPHNELHGGDAFVYCEVTDVSGSAARDILIVTPNTTKWAHMFIEVGSESEADYKLYEDATTSADGTGVTEVNRDRNSGSAATVVVTHTPTVSTTGTLICQDHWGSGKKSGGADRAIEEWILKQNAKYLVRVTNATGSANQIAIALNWYEHTNA